MSDLKSPVNPTAYFPSLWEETAAFRGNKIHLLLFCAVHVVYDGNVGPWIETHVQQLSLAKPLASLANAKKKPELANYSLSWNSPIWEHVSLCCIFVLTVWKKAWLQNQGMNQDISVLLHT